MPTLENDRIRLEPLGHHHLDELRRRCNDPALWEFTFSDSPFGTGRDTAEWFERATAAPDECAFAIVDKMSGAVVGSTRYLDIQPEHHKLEIGWTFLAREFWRTHINRDSKFLLLQNAFDEWRALRVQFKAEARNERSRASMLAWGARYEGTLRNFRIRPRDGCTSDVAFYSVIAGEWPEIRDRLLSRMKSPIAT
jgi:RimJ/RimL family protein N-acetyltransferase